MSNLNETASNNPQEIYWAGGGTSRRNVANSFATGSNSGGYTLHSATVKFAATTGSPGALTVAIHSNHSSNRPDGNTPVATLNGSNPTTAGDYEFTCSDTCDLAANTTYWLVMHSASGSHNTDLYNLTWTASNGQTGSGGWSIGDAAKRGSGNTINTVSWNAVSPAESFKFKVTAVSK